MPHSAQIFSRGALGSGGATGARLVSRTGGGFGACSGTASAAEPTFADFEPFFIVRLPVRPEPKNQGTPSSHGPRVPVPAGWWHSERMPLPNDLLEPLRRGNHRALGRAISWMENGHPGARELMARV